MAFFKDLKYGFNESFGEGREDHQRAFREAREQSGQHEEVPRIDSMLGTDPTIQRINELVDNANPIDVEVRNRMGLGLTGSRAEKIGRVLGTLASDVTQDRMREKWWLINAPQAAVNVIQEKLLSANNKDLFSAPYVRKPDGTRVRVDRSDPEVAEKMNLVSADDGETKLKGVGTRKDPDSGKYYYTKRNYEPGWVSSLMWPTGIATNVGIGVLNPSNPFGGADGFTAALPSDEDPTVSKNAIGEVAARYFLGRTGDMLPYDEFVKYRPDVSKGEYKAYKAFKYAKDADLNPLDGDITLPTGVLKATADGVHGPELQFLGRSMPLTTAGIPIASAMLGTTLGVRSKKPIRGGLIGGIGGMVAGSTAGNLIEQERRRRNAEENFGS